MRTAARSALDYGLVHALKAALGDWPIAINGGLSTLDAALEQVGPVDGVMIGRAAYHNPDMLLDVDPRLFGTPAPFAGSAQAVEAYMPYMAHQLEQGVRLHDMTRHLLGLFAGQPGARLWRRHLATEAPKAGAGLDVVRVALGHVRPRAQPETVAA